MRNLHVLCKARSITESGLHPTVDLPGFIMMLQLCMGIFFQERLIRITIIIIVIKHLSKRSANAVQRALVTGPYLVYN